MTMIRRFNKWFWELFEAPGAYEIREIQDEHGRTIWNFINTCDEVMAIRKQILNSNLPDNIRLDLAEKLMRVHVDIKRGISWIL